MMSFKTSIRALHRQAELGGFAQALEGMPGVEGWLFGEWQDSAS
jgi:hypothetical protein